MSSRSISLTDSLYGYLLEVSLREPDLLLRLREETAADPMARMQISPEQGQFMALLVRLMGARRCIEVGVFTGYSSLCVATALPADGRIVACDVSEHWTGDREAVLGGGRCRAQDRPQARARGRDARFAAGCRRFRELRLRVHRRRQDELCRLLRAVARVAAAGRPDRGRQHAVERPRRRSRGGRRGHRRAQALQRAPAPRRARRPEPVAGRRRPHAGPQAIGRICQDDIPEYGT